MTEERYLERCRLKTASLFEASCRLGALFGGRPELAETLGRFGERLGVAFQMLDDVLDVSGPPERTGKPRGADLLDGTVTLPLILARRKDPVTHRRACAAPRRRRRSATGSPRPARWRRRASRRSPTWPRRRRVLGEIELSEPRTAALDLVADGVVERYA